MIRKPSRRVALFACVWLYAALLASAQGQDARTTLFNGARTLIEANCATCTGRNQSALEEGIRLALEAKDAGYPDRVAVLRLLKDGYGTLGAFFFGLGDPRRAEALRLNDEFLKQLVDAAPLDANARYEHTHRSIGNIESMIADIDERIRQYRLVLALDPRHEKAQFDLAQDLFRKGEDEESDRLLRALSKSSDPERAKVAAQRLENFASQRASSKQVVAPTTFVGEAFRGKDFEKEFGAGLVFRLAAQDDLQAPGWEVQVRGKDSTDAEYSWVVTPPFRGLNPRYLFVGYGLSAAEIVEGGASFKFVRTKPDYDRARANVQIILGRRSDGRPYQEAFDAALEDSGKIPYCVGALRILNSKLTPAEEGRPQAIDWIQFEVELCGKSRY
jgi:tetratricopeptide (TPR) repeat protein